MCYSNVCIASCAGASINKHTCFTDLEWSYIVRFWSISVQKTESVFCTNQATINQLKGALHFGENITWYRKEINKCNIKYHGKHAMPTSRSHSVNSLKLAVLRILRVTLSLITAFYVLIENATSLRTDSRGCKEPYSDLFTKRKEPYSRSIEIRQKCLLSHCVRQFYFVCNEKDRNWNLASHYLQKNPCPFAVKGAFISLISSESQWLPAIFVVCDKFLSPVDWQISFSLCQTILLRL